MISEILYHMYVAMMKNKNIWLKTIKFKRSGDCAKATTIIIFLKLQFVFLLGNKTIPTKYKYIVLINHIINEDMIIAFREGPFIGPKSNLKFI